MVVRGLYTGALDHDGVLLFLTRAAAVARKRRSTAGRTWTHEFRPKPDSVRMLLSFQRPPRHPLPGDSRRSTRGRRKRRPPDKARNYSAMGLSLSFAGAHEPLEAALADAQDAAVEGLGADVDLRHRLVVERHRPLRRSGAVPASARCRRARRSAPAGARAVLGRERRLLDLARLAAVALDAVPLGLLALGRLRAVVDRGQLACQRALRAERVRPGRRAGARAAARTTA